MHHQNLNEIRRRTHKEGAFLSQCVSFAVIMRMEGDKWFFPVMCKVCLLQPPMINLFQNAVSSIQKGKSTLLQATKCSDQLNTERQITLTQINPRSASFSDLNNTNLRNYHFLKFQPLKLLTVFNQSSKNNLLPKEKIFSLYSRQKCEFIVYSLEFYDQKFLIFFLTFRWLCITFFQSP